MHPISAKIAVVLGCLLIVASIVRADDPRTATLPATADLAVMERTPPSVPRNLCLVRLTLPKLDDRTPLEATVVSRENGQDAQIRTMARPDPKDKNHVVFARACIPAEDIAEGIVRLRERNRLTGKIETIDFPLVDAVEIEKP